MKEWRSKKVVIVGAARQGLALARYLLLHGAQVVLNDHQTAQALAAAQQSLSDLASVGLPLTWICGGHPLEILDNADLLCISGGVPLNLPLIVEAQRRGIPLTNDSQIFMELVPCKVIGITGSAGKTTTTTLVGRMASAALNLAGSAPYRQVWVGGNIGSPLISMVDEMTAADLAIVEFSSFQLELMTCSPQIAAVLNITPNHLDRHVTMEAYTAAKARILQFQSADSIALLGRDDPGAWALRSVAAGLVLSFGLSELPSGQLGAFTDDQGICLRFPVNSQPSSRVLNFNQIALRGQHNLLNVMAACAIAAAAGLPIEAMRAGVVGFGGVPHRLEYVRTWGGADWYNDSIATAPERAMAAIRSFDEPLVLLAGGRDKSLPWDDFATLISQRVDHLILFGEAAEKIAQVIERRNTASSSLSAGLGYHAGLTVSRCSGLEDAVQTAAQIVQPGDVVLLSPGGTSFDEFKDFEERGLCFTQWVNNLP
jgi:UDP-N-acetylmuramoylalanine--D-glutamate ligase